MSNELVKLYTPHVDEAFKAESKRTLLTNTDYDWTGAHSIVLWKIATAPMNDYQRNRFESDEAAGTVTLTRFGELYDLATQTEELILKKDRSFIFNIDRLDEDETNGGLGSASALARQVKDVVIPEIDKYTYNAMVTGAGTTATATALTKDNIYSSIIAGTKALDDAEVPDTERVAVVTPETYNLLKQATEFDHTDIGNELKRLGVVAVLDGMNVIKIPAARLPEGFGFMIAHPCATVAPVKLDDYGVHNDTPLASGTIVTGRICYDAFVLDNKKKGIYYHPIA